MKALIRFGRRIPIPSTIQLRHELRLLCAEENVRERCAKDEGLSASASWENIYGHRDEVIDASSRGKTG